MPLPDRKAGLAALLLIALATPALAKVPAAEAERLNKELTPVGALRAGNKDGSIPAWDGGLQQAPACYSGSGKRYCDPYASDQPLLTISAANLAQHRARLSAGQQAMLAKVPSYQLRIYPTRRSYAAPEFVYAASYQNALKAELGGNGEALVGAITGVPFPIPKSGFEAMWNHKLRYRGIGMTRWNAQAAVTSGGDFNLVKLREDASFVYSRKDARPEQLDNVANYFMQVVTQPPRLAGTITLVHETMDQVKEPRRAWQYNPGQRRLRRAPNVGYDNPGTGSDGLRTNDQFDVFNGAMDRYSWKLLGSRELYVPYNAYALHGDKHKYRDLVRPGHLNPALPRYELHRVWVVEAELKAGTSHIYAKRRFYLDEDSWQILLADCYDRRGQLWRWQEAHPIQAYDKPFATPILETVYDLQSGRYLLMAMNNEEQENVERDFEPAYFEPANVQKQASK
ncbi:MAG TPA: DUF1329 domain-containing protein [Solimonas sp.]|nr:DUF1329 domain-containing protein [Solimonas sp.]